MTPKHKTAALIAGFALLSVIAVAGWTRNPVSASNNSRRLRAFTIA